MPVPERDHDLRDKEKIMADVTSRVETYNNAGSSQATFGANFEQIVNTQGLSGRLIIATVEKNAGDEMTEAEFVTVLKALGSAQGDKSGTDINGPDAFTVVGISDFDGTDPVYVALQGTGTLDTGANNLVSGFTVTTVATFALAV
jgi:hypothetical protein